MTTNQWTPNPFDLRRGNPFTYDIEAISATSATEAFDTGIDTRDNGACIVCNEDFESALEHAHIIPKGEKQTWKLMRDKGFIPVQAKSVKNEARNGILLCKAHHGLFDLHCYYIRWVPEPDNRFVLINHSQIKSLERYHGRAVKLSSEDSRVPFHGAFLSHEMRVRGRWPFAEDRPISRPIHSQRWINPDFFGDEQTKTSSTPSTSHVPVRRRPARPHNLDVDKSSVQNVIPMTNPFENKAQLDDLKRSFHEQPNWKAAVVEGESWEGSAEDNISKWQKLLGVGLDD